MDMKTLLQTQPEDVSGHDEQCPFRRFIELDIDSRLLTPATMEDELRKNYEVEAVLSRPGSRKRKRGKRNVTTVESKPLTSDEVALVNQKVEKAIEPKSLIHWYLKSQRKEVEQTKAHLQRLCECANPKMDVDANVESGISVSVEGAVKVQPDATKSEELLASGEDFWMEEDGSLYF